MRYGTYETDDDLTFVPRKNSSSRGCSPTKKMSDKKNKGIDNLSEVEALRTARASVYSFFASFFDAARNQTLLDEWPTVERIIAIETALLQGEDPVAKQKSDKLTAGNLLESDYAKLFYGVGESTISLCESSYSNIHRMVCQEPMRTLAVLYQNHGFRVIEERSREADSLPIEMAFASLLLQNKSSITEQKELIVDHIYPLALLVANEVNKRTKNKDILAVINGMERFLGLELRLLQ